MPTAEQRFVSFPNKYGPYVNTIQTDSTVYRSQIPCAGEAIYQRTHVASISYQVKTGGIPSMEKLISRKEAAEILGISLTTLDTARQNGLIAYIQYVENGCVYFTSACLQDYIQNCTHRANPIVHRETYRKPRTARC